LDGSGYHLVYTFGGSDGAEPRNGMLAIGNTLYGTTETGGPAGWGTVFALAVPEPSGTALASTGGLACLLVALARRRRQTP
jgi:uncharacterized repeat protein (TIGR03803 family)